MKIISEAYLDAEEQFYDYHTEEVSGNNIFSLKTTGMSYYNNFINDPDYMEDSKNLKAEIKQLTPKEYFEGCAEIFNSSVDKQISYTSMDEDTIEHLKQVITQYKKRFPVTFLNYAHKQQEGRHRMYVAGELFGWDTKHPVMIITWANEERHQKQVEQERHTNIVNKIDKAVDNALQFNYYDMEDFHAQLQMEIDRAFFGYGSSETKPYTYKEDKDVLVIEVDGVSYELDKVDIKFKEEQDDIEDNLLLDDDIDKWLADYLSDTWDSKTEEEKAELRNKVRNA